jgi:hypothetical protein
MQRHGVRLCPRGRNRLDALALLDRLALDGPVLCIKRADGSLRQVKSFRTITGGDPEAYAYSLNVHRRHLDPKQKRDLIARLLKAAPETSDRQIAKAAKASPTFVGKVRAEKEAIGDVSTVDTRTDTKGRKQPARKPTKKAKAEAPASKSRRVPKPDSRIIAPEVAERVGRVVAKLVALDTDLARELADLILERGAPERLWNDITTTIDFEELKATDPETSADTMKAQLAALDDGVDPGPLPESLRRRS